MAAAWKSSPLPEDAGSTSEVRLATPPTPSPSVVLKIACVAVTWSACAVCVIAFHVVLPDASMRFKDAKAKVLDAFERQYLQDLLQRHRQNISKAAREAGIDRRHLYRLLDKYSIEIKDRPTED